MKISAKTIAVFGAVVLSGVGIIVMNTSVNFSPPLTGRVSQPSGVHQDCRDAYNGICEAEGDAQWGDTAFVSGNTCIEDAHAACDEQLDPDFTYGACGPNRDCVGLYWKTCKRDCIFICTYTKKNCCGNHLTEPPEECDEGSALPTLSCTSGCRGLIKAEFEDMSAG